MNCQDALNRLYEIIDKEASDIDVAQVREHLENCHHCFEVYRVESAVNDLLKEKAKSLTAPASLVGVEKLKGRLLAQLDQIDTETCQMRVQSVSKPFGKFALSLAIAASLMVIVGAGIVGRGLYYHHVTYMPFEHSHFRVEGNTETPFDHTVPVARAIALGDSIHVPLTETVDGFKLVNGHVEDLLGVRMGHFVYENGSKLVSVFAAPASEFKIPDDLKNSTFMSGGREYFSHNCRGCRLLYVRNGNMVLVGATTDQELDITPFLKNHGTA